MSKASIKMRDERWIPKSKHYSRHQKLSPIYYMLTNNLLNKQVGIVERDEVQISDKIRLVSQVSGKPWIENHMASRGNK